MLGFYTGLYTEVHWRRIRPEASERPLEKKIKQTRKKNSESCNSQHF